MNIAPSKKDLRLNVVHFNYYLSTCTVRVCPRNRAQTKVNKSSFDRKLLHSCSCDISDPRHIMPGQEKFISIYLEKKECTSSEQKCEDYSGVEIDCVDYSHRIVQLVYATSSN
jgi:hypothetical protein